MIRCAVIAAALALAAPAQAQDAPPEGAPDMTKMGPMAKTVTNEAATQKELAEWFKKNEALGMKCDVEGMADMIDFPVIMMSDNMAGKFGMMQLDRAQWIAMMKPFMDPDAMKDMKMTSKYKCFLMSDDLASCEGALSMTIGKEKAKFNNHVILTRVDGKWKGKTMMEAGWGDMPAPK